MADAVLKNEAQRAGFTSVEAERNILRRMIVKEGVAEDVVEQLTQNDFSNPQLGKLFSAMQKMVNEHRQIDPAALDAEMTHMFGKDGWNNTLIVRVIHATDQTISSWQNIDELVKLVRNLSIRRQAIAKLESLVDGLKDPTQDFDGVMSQIGEATDAININTSSGVKLVPIGTVLLNTFDYIERRQKGEIKAITSGLKCLDRLIGGFFQGEMTIVAARPSVGKSAFGVNIALSAAHKGHKVVIVSGEMEDIGLGQRLFSHGAWVDGMSLRRADIDEAAWEKLAIAMNEMNDLPIQFMFDCLTVEDIVSEASRLARRGEMELLVIDYLQYLETKATFKEQRLKIAYISHCLKKLAKEMHIPVIVLAQVTREGEGVMPTMKMLMESSNIEQDADGIIFLHRPKTVDDSSVNPDHKCGWNNWVDNGVTYLSIGVAKQRNGAVGITNVLFDAELMRYIEIIKDEEAKQ